MIKWPAHIIHKKAGIFFAFIRRQRLLLISAVLSETRIFPDADAGKTQLSVNQKKGRICLIQHHSSRMLNDMMMITHSVRGVND